MRLELGMPVRCTDAKLGELQDVVIDPGSKRITHVVVCPHRQLGPARLVPIELVDTSDGSGISLRCSTEEAGRLESVQDFAFVRLGQFPVNDPRWDVGVEYALAMPVYRTTDLGGDAYAYDEPVGVSFDRVPKGEVEIRRSSAVIASDGHVVGHVEGFLLGDDGQITHLVVKQGHLWRRREVQIPIGAIEKVETDAVTIDLTRRELKNLPPAQPRSGAAYS